MPEQTIPCGKFLDNYGSIVEFNNTSSIPTVDSIVAQDYASVLIDNVRLDDAPTTYTSAALDIRGWSAVRLQIKIDSTLAPTDVRILVQTTTDGSLVDWDDFEEGLFASLYWEDTDTATEISKVFVWPSDGADYMRVVATATGSDATNYFDVTVRARQFRGAYATAHS